MPYHDETQKHKPYTFFCGLIAVAIHSNKNLGFLYEISLSTRLIKTRDASYSDIMPDVMLLWYRMCSSSSRYTQLGLISRQLPQRGFTKAEWSDAWWRISVSEKQIFFIDLIAYSQPVLSHYLFIFKLLPYPLLTHGQLNSINKTDNGTGVKSKNIVLLCMILFHSGTLLTII